MTQSADQQMIDSPTQGTDTPPARNFSADAFRALTQRLKSPSAAPAPQLQTQQPIPPASQPPVQAPVAPAQVIETIIDPVVTSTTTVPDELNDFQADTTPSEPVAGVIESIEVQSPDQVSPQQMPETAAPVFEPETATPEQVPVSLEATMTAPVDAPVEQTTPEPVANATMINLDGGFVPEPQAGAQQPIVDAPVPEPEPKPASDDPLAAAMALINGVDKASDASTLDIWLDNPFEVPNIAETPTVEPAPDATLAVEPQPDLPQAIQPLPALEQELGPISAPTTNDVNATGSIEPQTPDFQPPLETVPTAEVETAITGNLESPSVEPAPPIDIMVFDQQPDADNAALQLDQQGTAPAQSAASADSITDAEPEKLEADITVPAQLDEPQGVEQPHAPVEPDGEQPIEPVVNARETEAEPDVSPNAAAEPLAQVEQPALMQEPFEVETEPQPRAEQVQPDAQPVLEPKPASQPSVEAAQPPVQLEPDEKSGETARALLDMMSAPSGAAQPQERALAADTLLQLIPTMPRRDLLALSERVCMMEDGPQLLVHALINHPDAKVAQPLLENAPSLGDQELLKLAAVSDVDRLIMIAKRRRISSGVVDALIARGETPVNLTIVRNPGAQMSHDAFIALSEEAKSHPNLQAPLATRGDTPPPIAFELFWSLPIELRRYVLSRFLTDSATLDKILKIAQSIDSNRVEHDDEPKFPPKAKVEEFIAMVADGFGDRAADMLAEMGDVHPDNARRIIADPDGEPITVALKTVGCSRAMFAAAIKRFSTATSAMLSPDRNLEELSALFDSLSFNKARTLMKYWDWAVEKSGPYTRRMM